jgi:hypothetical protein
VKPSAIAKALVARFGPAQVARWLGAHEATVRSWATGRRTPSAAASKSLTALYAEKLDTKKAHAPVVADELAPMNARDGVIAQVADIRAEIAAAKKNGAAPREIASLHTSLTSALRLLARVSSELQVTEATLLRSAAWARVTRLLFDALRGYPEAAKAVEAAFSSLDDGTGAP